MPKLAVSNIALSAYDHAAKLGRLAELGLAGVEVAPSRAWMDTWHNLTPKMVRSYRKEVEDAGLGVVGLHSLFYDHPELGLFRDAETRAQSLDFLVHLSAVCRDLGGRTLIWGGGRRRGDVPMAAALTEAQDFMADLCKRIEGHDTCFCFEPLGPDETDFINSAFDALAIVEAVGHPGLRMQLDAKALLANAEATNEPFAAAAPHLVHFHANEPDLGVLGTSGAVDHAALGGFLRDIDYQGFVSIEQRMLNAADPLADVALSAAVLKECYQ
ncbi:MAG: sugar phosphate isomerase/epimerase family protein [Rhodospirillales bacterium]|nr:sugar phosphate isomerase/epimerase family protein [Rhodospirillales bacterium]